MSIDATRIIRLRCDWCEHPWTLTEEKDDEALKESEPAVLPPDKAGWIEVWAGSRNRHYCAKCALKRRDWLKTLREEGELPTEEIRTAIPDPDAPNPLGAPPP